jgi:hypothetical protein
VPLEDLLVLVERSFVPVFLQEFLLAFGFFFAGLLGSLEVFFEALFFRQSTPSLYLFSFLFSADFVLLVPFYAAEFAESPSLELAFGVKAIRVVDVRNDLLFLLCN